MSDWIEWKWTPEKPYPETLETEVNILMEGEDKKSIGNSLPVKEWIWHQHGDIITYKVVK